MTVADSAWEIKRRKLQEDNLQVKMKPLVELVAELREISEGRTVPNFDPANGMEYIASVRSTPLRL
jgi:hypothetical protein